MLHAFFGPKEFWKSLGCFVPALASSHVGRPEGVRMDVQRVYVWHACVGIHVWAWVWAWAWARACVGEVWACVFVYVWVCTGGCICARRAATSIRALCSDGATHAWSRRKPGYAMTAWRLCVGGSWAAVPLP